MMLIFSGCVLITKILLLVFPIENKHLSTINHNIAVALLILGTIVIAIGLFMFSQQIGGDRTHGLSMIFIWK